MLSQKVASNSALELPATPLLQKTSKASLRAWRRTSFRHNRSRRICRAMSGINKPHKPCGKECGSENNC